MTKCRIGARSTISRQPHARYLVMSRRHRGARCEYKSKNRILSYEHQNLKDLPPAPLAEFALHQALMVLRAHVFNSCLYVLYALTTTVATPSTSLFQVLRLDLAGIYTFKFRDRSFDSFDSSSTTPSISLLDACRKYIQHLIAHIAPFFPGVSMSTLSSTFLTTSPQNQ
jgi:hypothetical protein